MYEEKFKKHIEKDPRVQEVIKGAKDIINNDDLRNTFNELQESFKESQMMEMLGAGFKKIKKEVSLLVPLFLH